MSLHETHALRLLPKIKVCGITQAEDLDRMSDLGVDTVGINLVPTSKRYVALDQAVQLVEAAQSNRLRTVAVLMNPTASWLSQVASAAPWDFMQLHGAESPDVLDQCRPIPIIKAISWTGRSMEAALAQTWADWEETHQVRDQPDSGQSGFRLACFLVDAFAPLEGGGTGRTADWAALHPRPLPCHDLPLLLAGGLTPENVGEAIAKSRCDGVDTASGVEWQAGRKSKDLVQKFVEQAKLGFSKIAADPLPEKSKLE